MYVYGDGVNRFVAANLFSSCWLDARGGQTDEMTDYLVVAGMAGLSLPLYVCSSAALGCLHTLGVTQRSSPSDIRWPPWDKTNGHNSTLMYTCASRHVSQLL